MQGENVTGVASSRINKKKKRVVCTGVGFLKQCHTRAIFW